MNVGRGLAHWACIKPRFHNGAVHRKHLIGERRVVDGTRADARTATAPSCWRCCLILLPPIAPVPLGNISIVRTHREAGVRRTYDVGETFAYPSAVEPETDTIADSLQNARVNVSRAVWHLQHVEKPQVVTGEDAACLPIPHAQTGEVRVIRSAVCAHHGGEFVAVRPRIHVVPLVRVIPHEQQLLTCKARGNIGIKSRSRHFQADLVVRRHALHGTDNLKALVRHRTGRERASARALHELIRDAVPEAHDAVAALHGNVVEELVAVCIVETHVRPPAVMITGRIALGATEKDVESIRANGTLREARLHDIPVQREHTIGESGLVDGRVGDSRAVATRPIPRVCPEPAAEAGTVLAHYKASFGIGGTFGSANDVVPTGARIATISVEPKADTIHFRVLEARVDVALC